MMSILQKVYAGQASVPLEPDNPLSGRFSTLSNVFVFVINLLLGVGWALVFVMLAMGFIQYVLSRGEKTAVDNAQKWLTYAVIGGVGLFFIYLLKLIIPQLMGGGEVGQAFLQF